MANTEWKIGCIEKDLGVKFPRSYREFLFEHRTVTIAGYTIIGVPKNVEPEAVEAKSPTTATKTEQTQDENGWLDFDEIKKSQLCPACGKNKEVGRITCYACYTEYANETSQRHIHIAIWIRKKRTELKTKRIESPKVETKKPSVTRRGIPVVEATEFLRKKRPDLADKKLIPVCFATELSSDRQMALCMDLSGSPKDDAPLVMIFDINQQDDPAKHDPGTFSEWLTYLKDQEDQSKKFAIAKQRIRNRKNEVRRFAMEKEIQQKFGRKCPVCGKQDRDKPLACQRCHEEWRNSAKDEFDFAEWVQKKLEEKGLNLPKFSHKGGKDVKHVHLRPQDWHARIFRVADYVVGLTAFRYNYQLGRLEVDAFWSGDLAGYAKGQAIRNLAIAVLSEANSLTGSLALAFTKEISENHKTGKLDTERRQKRISCPVPQNLVDFARAHQINLNQSQKGIISHQEGLDIFWAALGWPEHLQAKVDELERKGYLTKQALASVIYSGIWSKEEAVWFFENAPRPEAILLGSDLPEDRLYYTESLAWSRSAYLANLFRTKVSGDIAGGLSIEEKEESDCELEPYGGFWLLKSARDFTLPWMVKNNEPILVKANEPVLILSMPCQTTQEANDLSLIKEGFKVLKEIESPAKIRCLIVSFEFSDLKYGMKVAEFMKNNSKKLAERGVYLLFSPYRLDLLNDEVENRMSSARRKRQFSSRRTPLRLQLIEIPEARWQKPDLLYSVKDTQSAAYWIGRKIDLRLGRIRFRVNCSCIERIAIQDAGAKVIVVADGKDSKDILAAMTSENGITAPFIPPDEMPEVINKASGKFRNALKDIRGGLVAVTSFEKSEFSEEAETTASVAEIHAVASNFEFPVNPDRVDASSYAVNRHEEIARTHQQIQQALRTGEPLAVSYLRHEVFVEAMREYLFKKVRMDQVNLRIVYNDGGESRPFPLFCLTKRQKTEGLYQMKVGSISMRHATLDLVTDGYLIQNVMISKRKLSLAEQEDYAFRQTRRFLADFVDLLQHKRVQEITRDIRFRYLWDLLGLEGKKSKGCELHIFQTGLIPATVGIYRAVVEFLQTRRGELVVVPRLIGRKASAKGKEFVDAEYLKAAEWF
jgi:hypothetical protein